MPAPYSDNLYSANDSDSDQTPDDDLDDHLSPTDGYFQSSTSSSAAAAIYPPQQQAHGHYSQDDVIAATTFPTSAGVPHVPNVLIQDPSLRLQQEASYSSASKKDREAREETRLNSSPVGRTSSPAAPVDENYYYDDGVSSTAADSEATPSHTTTATTTAYTYTPSHTALSSSSYTPYAPSADAPLRTPQTHPIRSRYSHPASLFHIPREAPPAYTPSPTSPLASSPTDFRNYQTFTSNMGAPEEEARLLGRDPESMGGEPYDGDDDPRPSPSWRQRALKKHSWASRRTLKMALLAALVFFTVSGFLSMLVTSVRSMPSDKSPSKQPVKEYDPVTGLPIKDGPSQPNEPSQPGQPSNSIPWKPSRTCLQTEHRFAPKVYDLSFTPDKTLSVLQGVESDAPSRGFQPQVSGDFVVRRQQGNAPGPSVELEVVANDAALDVGVEWDSEHQELLIKTPQRIEWNRSLRPCIALRATIWVPENAELSHLYLAAINVGVKLAGDLSIVVENGFEIGTMSGDVHNLMEPQDAHRLNSRDIAVRTMSGDITGSWPLYDSLKVASDSGDIHVGVTPQQVSESKPRPAVLEVSTISGDITVKEPLDAAVQSSKPDTVVPPRDYITTLDTKSGGIRAWVAFSSAAAIESISGDIAAEFLPVYNISLLQSTKVSELHTKTKSGDVAVKVLDPIWVEIAGTEGAPSVEKPRVNPDEPVEIPTNPLPIPNIPKIPRMPGAPFIPDFGNPYKRIPVPAGRWTDAWPIRRSSSADAATQTDERTVSTSERPPMRHFKSTHGSVSGDMEIRYPSSWEGSATAESISGKISIRGNDVHIDSRTQWPKAVHAHKGQALNCEVSLGSVSGGVDLIIGEETKAM
ncbi:hypothetical protein QIS74_02451 [Colletotrichum tabaci]|uniref:DUF4097 domain-containing protein n=1 Tax=Colletotrichum tabaci TaxID=1209068 RepID=A0AAV9TSX3_9PEZI